jgi:hypothetical protein
MRLALLNCLAGLEGDSAQLYQLPLGGVVGLLQRLGPIGRTPQRGSQAWIPRANKIKKGTNPRREDHQTKGTKRQLTFNLLPVHLESLVPALDRLLQADDRGALLLEGPVLILVRDAEGDQLPVELRDLIPSLLQRRLRPFESSMLPLERRPGIDEGGPLLLELTLGLLAGGTLLPELLLHCDDRSGLGGEGGLQLLGLLGPLLGLPRPLLGLASPGQRLLELRAVLPALSPDGDHLRLLVCRYGARPLQVPSRLLQRLVPVDEGCANPLNGRGARRGLPLQLQELVAQSLFPVCQPAVPGPQGLGEGVESVALLPELAELSAHLVEGAVPVVGTEL